MVYFIIAEVICLLVMSYSLGRLHELRHTKKILEKWGKTIDDWKKERNEYLK